MRGEKMSSREKHKKRSCRSYNKNMGSFASHARSSITKGTQKQARKSIFEGIKNGLAKMFKKTKEG